MSDNSAMCVALNAVLCGATGFGLYKLAPAEHPWAFTSCLIGFTHGLVGLVSGLASDENAKKMGDTTASIMEIVPLPLLNLDLFLGGQGNKIALGHGLFIAPLTVSVILAFWKTDGTDEEVAGTVNTLRVLTILGNITCLVFLALNEDSVRLAAMAALAFTAKFGAEICDESVVEGCGPAINYVCWSGIYVLAAFTISGEK